MYEMILWMTGKFDGMKDAIDDMKDKVAGVENKVAGVENKVNDELVNMCINMKSALDGKSDK